MLAVWIVGLPGSTIRAQGEGEPFAPAEVVGRLREPFPGEQGVTGWQRRDRKDGTERWVSQVGPAEFDVTPEEAKVVYLLRGGADEGPQDAALAAMSRLNRAVFHSQARVEQANTVLTRLLRDVHGGKPYRRARAMGYQFSLEVLMAPPVGAAYLYVIATP